MKFGGSSVGNSERIRNVSYIVRSQERRDPIVVVSAVGGVTNDLIAMAKEAAEGKGYGGKLDTIIERHRDILRELDLSQSVIEDEIAELRRHSRDVYQRGASPKALDSMASFGERLSARITAACISSIGAEARAHDAYDLGMITDSNFGNADILPKTYGRIRERLSYVKELPVVTGFIGKDSSGNVTTLGRGGSDYTASIIGKAVKSSEIQIWTNTNGIMTADPKIVKSARNIRNLSYEEELELERLGANTLHPRGIKPAFESSIPVRILNTLQPRQKGTLISESIAERNRVASITHKDEIYIIHISATDPAAKLAEIHRILERHGISIDTMSTSKAKVMVILSGYQNRGLAAAIKDLRTIGRVEVMDRMAKVSVVGKGVSSMADISVRMLSSVSGIKVAAISCGSSETSQSFFVKEADAGRAIRKLHKEFFGA